MTRSPSLRTRIAIIAALAALSWVGVIALGVNALAIAGKVLGVVS